MAEKYPAIFLFSTERFVIPNEPSCFKKGSSISKDADKSSWVSEGISGCSGVTKYMY